MKVRNYGCSADSLSCSYLCPQLDLRVFIKRLGKPEAIDRDHLRVCLDVPNTTYHENDRGSLQSRQSLAWGHHSGSLFQRLRVRFKLMSGD